MFLRWVFFLYSRWHTADMFHALHSLCIPCISSSFHLVPLVSVCFCCVMCARLLLPMNRPGSGIFLIVCRRSRDWIGILQKCMLFFLPPVIPWICLISFPCSSCHVRLLPKSCCWSLKPVHSCLSFLIRASYSLSHLILVHLGAAVAATAASRKHESDVHFAESGNSGPPARLLLPLVWSSWHYSSWSSGSASEGNFPIQWFTPDHQTCLHEESPKDSKPHERSEWQSLSCQQSCAQQQQHE